MNNEARKGTAREQIMEMISVIEDHLQQTREILDRIARTGPVWVVRATMISAGRSG